ncbi:NADP-dependent oxidoreductase [soil metagenome]
MSDQATTPLASSSDGPSLPATMQQVVLRKRPDGLLTWDDVELIEVPLPELAEGEALLHNEVFGIDASVRSWLSPARGYLPPVEPGEAVRCSSTGRVVASRCDAYAVGDIVTTLANWEGYTIVRDDIFTTSLSGPDPDYDVAAFLALYGSTGCTAYIGMVEVAKVQAGETVVVSAAAGATGNVAAQIAKLKGATVIGIAGSDDKCAWLVDQVGLDGAINYKTEDIPSRLKELAPLRVDVFFDNVGGDVLDAVLARLAMHARVVLCGAISGDNDTGKPPGPSNYLNLIQQRASMTGFLALDDIPRFPEIGEQLRAWVDEGKLQYQVHEFDGLESSVDALNAMFTGANTGKIMIRMGPSPL